MILSVDGIDFAYGSGRILSDVRFDVAPGEFLAVLGNNGAGKSTLLKCLNRILRPQCGTVLIDGADMRHLDRLGVAKRMGYVAQRPDQSQMTVFDAVLLGRRPHIQWDATPNDLDIAHRMIARLGLEDLALRPLDELSGGELQKTVIARALAQEPRVMLLDEPTSSLDLRNQLDVLETVKRVTAEEGVSVISVMHDLNLALRFASAFLFLSRGSVFAAGGPEVVTAENVAHVYGVPVRVPVFDGMPVVVPV